LRAATAAPPVSAPVEQIAARRTREALRSSAKSVELEEVTFDISQKQLCAEF
jgi:hypothetical protein